jgi:lysozyme
MAGKKPIKRKPRPKKKAPFWNTQKKGLLLVVFVLLVFGSLYHYRNGLAYYLGFKSNKTVLTKEEKHLSDVRNFQVLNKYQEKVAGFDVSQYQGKINWSRLRKIENNYPLGFVFIRASVGKDMTDTKFEYNWREAKKNKIIRGAYHYYRPNENSIEQAENFIKTVKLQKGDLPPVLDIEKLPKDQSLDSLKVGLKRWLERIDAHYKVKPIIYTGERYYDDFLKKEFSGYTFWIANYNFFVEDLKDDWLFWQFTEKATIPGIVGSVDLNIYNGTPKMLQYLTIN